MANELWRLCNEHSTAKADTGSIFGLQSTEQVDLVVLLDHGTKPFLGHMSKRFPSYLLHNSFKARNFNGKYFKCRGER